MAEVPKSGVAGGTPYCELDLRRADDNGVFLLPDGKGGWIRDGERRSPKGLRSGGNCPCLRYDAASGEWKKCGNKMTVSTSRLR